MAVITFVKGFRDVKKITHSNETQAQGHVVWSVYRTPELTAEANL